MSCLSQILRCQSSFSKSIKQASVVSCKFVSSKKPSDKISEGKTDSNVEYSKSVPANRNARKTKNKADSNVEDIKYVPENQSLKDLLKEHTRFRPYSYVYQQETAKHLTTTILKNRKEKKAPILEIRSGPGVLTSEFLQQGVSQVIGLENKQIFTDMLKNVQNLYGPERFQKLNWHMLNFYLKRHNFENTVTTRSYAQYEAQVAELLQKGSQKYGGCYSLVSIGGTKENADFIYYILNYLAEGDDKILSRKGVEFFFLVHPKFKVGMENLVIRGKGTKSAMPIFVMCTTLYDFSIIGQVPGTSFMKPFSSSKNTRTKNLDTTIRHIAKMQLKENIEDILPLSLHASYFLFLKQVLRQSTGRLVPVVEMLVPGSGLRVIGHGFTMMDICRDIDPHKLVTLYREMITWSEYDGSPLERHIRDKTTGGIADYQIENTTENVADDLEEEDVDEEDVDEEEILHSAQLIQNFDGKDVNLLRTSQVTDRLNNR